MRMGSALPYVLPMGREPGLVLGTPPQPRVATLIRCEVTYYCTGRLIPLAFPDVCFFFSSSSYCTCYSDLQKLYIFGARRRSILKRKGKKIKVMYDEMKKFIYKPQVIMIYIT